MKITGIQVYQVNLAYKGDGYNMSTNRSYCKLDSTIVEIRTDAGITGYGEMCPFGTNYLPQFASGTRAGLRELAPHLLGEDPLELDRLNERMDYLFCGHPYVKSPIDMACWDILGKFSKLPIYTLMGGKLTKSIKLYYSLGVDSLENLVKHVEKEKINGYLKYQTKLSGEPFEDIVRLRGLREILDPKTMLIGDVNTGYKYEEAIRLANGVKDLDVYIEQPCMSYEECLKVRQRTQVPMVLDECITDAHSILRAHMDNAAEAVVLRISKQGGMTKTKKLRDLCVSLGISFRMEDTVGSDIVSAATTHLAHSSPEKNLFASWVPNTHVDVSTASGAPQQVDNHIEASDKPGLGIEPRMEVLGEPVFIT